MQRQQKKNIIHVPSTAYTTLRQPATDLRMWRRSSQKWQPDVAAFSWGDRSIFAPYPFQNFTSARRSRVLLRPPGGDAAACIRICCSTCEISWRMLAAMTFVGNIAAAHAGRLTRHR